MRYKSCPAQFKAIDEDQGIFEALVAVFGNVDRCGDRIHKGAFANTLAKWAESGDPIPVIYSHNWDNIDAHIGEVLEATETDEGLLVRGQIDLEEDPARRVFKRMQRRTLKEFSFAYDEIECERTDQGDKAERRYINELLELELYEVGPTLVGMNPDTQLLVAKNALMALKAGAPGYTEIQQIHDLAIALGAKASPGGTGPDGGESDPDKDKAGDGKSSGEAGILAVRLAAEMIEEGFVER